jgi:hypothetical protein
VSWFLLYNNDRTTFLVCVPITHTHARASCLSETVCAYADPTDSNPSFHSSVSACSAVPFFLIVRPPVVPFQTLITLYFAKGRNKMSLALVFIKPSATVVVPREFLLPLTTLCSHVLNLNSSLFTVLRVKPMLKWLEDMKMWRNRCMRTRIFHCACMNRGKTSSLLLISRYHHHHHRNSHFSALAGKYSPILGCNNQQD